MRSVLSGASAETRLPRPVDMMGASAGDRAPRRSFDDAVMAPITRWECGVEAAVEREAAYRARIAELEQSLAGRRAAADAAPAKE